jgi:hypothetical protein
MGSLDCVPLLRALQRAYRRGGVASPMDWDAPLLHLIRMMVDTDEQPADPPTALLCVRWLLFGSYRPCMGCQTTRSRACGHCQMAEDHVRLAHTLFRSRAAPPLLNGIARQLEQQISSPDMPRWSVMVRGLLYVQWASPDRVVAFLLASCQRVHTDLVGTLLVALATLLHRRAHPIAHTLEGLVGDLKHLIGDSGAVSASLRAVPWVSQWHHTASVWHTLAPGLHRVGLYVASHNFRICCQIDSPVTLC